MSRVLKPGGRAVIMVYHRGWWNYYVVHGFIRGILCGALLRHRTLSRIVQAHTDGALARYYSKSSWRDLASKSFSVQSIEISGNDSEILPLPSGRIKRVLLNIMPDFLIRFFLVKLRMGSFLISEIVKE